MPAPLSTIEVSRLAAGRARLRLLGELDYDTAPELHWKPPIGCAGTAAPSWRSTSVGSVSATPPA
ncbi:hypothetical protein [Micromonospora sp. NPDC002575]|uniref:hypothetical protein n=1 Tax=Micromonospora sp. NPDC002575 TaxID=3364222 RepID=UPI003676180B